MDKICIMPGSVYQGEGISKGLARGLLVYYGDCNLTGEGMGIGSIALRDHECTYFSRSWTDSAESGTLKRTFTIDTRMIWGVRGKPSTLLTRWIESGISAYMHLPWFQSILMLPVLPLRTLLCIHPLFETIAPRGKATFTYRVTGQEVEIHVKSTMPVRPKDTLCLYTIYRGREQSGDLCWAGFCLELGPLDGVQDSLEARYCIGFTQGACP